MERKIQIPFRRIRTEQLTAPQKEFLTFMLGDGLTKKPGAVGHNSAYTGGTWSFQDQEYGVDVEVRTEDDNGAWIIYELSSSMMLVIELTPNGDFGTNFTIDFGMTNMPDLLYNPLLDDIVAALELAMS